MSTVLLPGILCIWADYNGLNVHDEIVLQPCSLYYIVTYISPVTSSSQLTFSSFTPRDCYPSGDYFPVFTEQHVQMIRITSFSYSSFLIEKPQSWFCYTWLQPSSKKKSKNQLTLSVPYTYPIRIPLNESLWQKLKTWKSALTSLVLWEQAQANKRHFC